MNTVNLYEKQRVIFLIAHKPVFVSIGILPLLLKKKSILLGYRGLNSNSS